MARNKGPGKVGGPGLAFETWVSPHKWSWPEHPGLKSETWATHSLFVRTIFIEAEK